MLVVLAAGMVCMLVQQYRVGLTSGRDEYHLQLNSTTNPSPSSCQSLVINNNHQPPNTTYNPGFTFTSYHIDNLVLPTSNRTAISLPSTIYTVIL